MWRTCARETRSLTSTPGRERVVPLVDPDAAGILQVVVDLSERERDRDAGGRALALKSAAD